MRFAAETGLNGKVYAVETNLKYLNYIKNEAKQRDLDNIITLLVDKELYGLPKKGCDLIFLRNSYHHIENPDEYFPKLKLYLKKMGKLQLCILEENIFLSLFGELKGYGD
jgi:arsenite methyltransferase